MEDIILGAFAVFIGAVFCFRGFLVMRLVIPIWGALAGFTAGASFVASITDERFLSSVLAWVVGLATALVFFVLAYLYYSVAVIIGMSAIGFALGTSAMVAIGVSWSWVIMLVGLTSGILLAIVAIMADLPMALLSVLTALAGASAMVGGVMLMVGTFDTDDITASASVTERLADNPWWYLAYGVLVIAGLIAQFTATNRIRATMREAWETSTFTSPSGSNA
jgi:hypothetical protein